MQMRVLKTENVDIFAYAYMTAYLSAFAYHTEDLNQNFNTKLASNPLVKQLFLYLCMFFL